MTCPSNRSGVTIWEGQEDNEDGEADKILDNALTISRYSMLHVTASKASNYSVELMDNFYSCQILSCINEVRLYWRIECSGENRKLPTIFAELPYSCWHVHRRSWFLFSFLLIPMFAQDHLPPTHRSPHPTSISPISWACLCKALLTICKISIYTKTLLSEWLCMQLIVWSKNSCSQ